MRKVLVPALAGMLAFAVPSTAITQEAPVEGCYAYNPGMEKCSFTVTVSTEGPVSGAAGFGTWVVKVKRGKKTITLKSPPQPGSVEFLFKKGDRVSVAATASGSGVVAGGR